MAKYLVIVESPAKVKTIKKFLGKNYEVAASNGHVRDLPKSQSLRPKSMEELLKKTGFAMPQMADILQRLIQKDFITESFKNYYIRKI